MKLNIDKIKIFAGNSNIELAKGIANKLGIELGKATIKKFSDGEISVNIEESVRGKDIYIIQSTSDPADSNLMELLIMTDAFRRASAKTITAVIPYYGYARQDRVAKPRDPITSKLIANLITVSGIDRVLTMDLHASQIQGYFDIPVDHLVGVPILAQCYKDKFASREDVVVVSPDLGSVSRVRNFAERLDLQIAIIDKRRPKANVSEVMNVIGDIKGKICILLDDMIDTAGTLTNGAKAIIKLGAKEVYACCTHPVFSGKAIERIQDSPIKEVLVLDTIHLSEEKLIDKIKVHSVADTFAEAIKKIENNEPLTDIFN